MEWRGAEPLLLASTSATRRGLLERAGLPVETMPPGVDERAFEAGLPQDGRAPPALAAALAGAKALAVASRHPERVVVGADQVLDLDGEAIAKAPDAGEARRMLGRLSGRTHRLHSAVTVVRDGAVAAAFVETASLMMRDMDEAAVAHYVAAAGPAALRSAGGYEIEGLGIHLFARVDGEHSAILGLPLLPLLAALRRLGLLDP